MKKSFHFVMLFIFFFNCIASAQSFFKPETVFVDAVNAGEATTTMYHYDYDEDYFLISREAFLCLGDDTYEALMTAYYEYDFYGNVTEKLIVDPDGENISLETRNYSAGILSDVLYQEWNGDDWENRTFDQYNYTESYIAMIHSVWTNGIWSPTDLFTTTREGNVEQILEQYMQGGAWQNRSLQFVTYGDDGKVTEILLQKWENSVWNNDTQKVYHYSNGLLENVVENKWEQGAWTVYAKCEYEYDGQGNATQGCCYRKTNDGWEAFDGELEMFYQDNEQSEIFMGRKVVVHYTDLTGVEEEPAAAGLTFYPNPVKDVLMISADDFQKAEVYSITGAKVAETTSNQVNVRNLGSGTYLLKVYGLGGVQSRVFIVK